MLKNFFEFIALYIQYFKFLKYLAVHVLKFFNLTYWDFNAIISILLLDNIKTIIYLIFYACGYHSLSYLFYKVFSCFLLFFFLIIYIKNAWNFKNEFFILFLTKTFLIFFIRYFLIFVIRYL